MLSCSIWFSAPSLWMGGGLESRCGFRVYSADCPHHKHSTWQLPPCYVAKLAWPRSREVAAQYRRL